MDLDEMVELVNDGVCDVTVTVLHDLLGDLGLETCELDEDCVCNDCMKCLSRCCMDRNSPCTSCLCC